MHSVCYVVAFLHAPKGHRKLHALANNENDSYECICICSPSPSASFSGRIKPLPKRATRNVTMAALLIEEVTRQLAKE